VYSNRNMVVYLNWLEAVLLLLRDNTVNFGPNGTATLTHYYGLHMLEGTHALNSG
jgi:hypothetical protein